MTAGEKKENQMAHRAKYRAKKKRKGATQDDEHDDLAGELSPGAGSALVADVRESGDLTGDGDAPGYQHFGPEFDPTIPDRQGESKNTALAPSPR